jgi:hypothetical protein
MIADQTMPPWLAGDEVHGHSSELRTFLQDSQIGYVAGRVRLHRADALRYWPWPATPRRRPARLSTLVTEHTRHRRRWLALVR